MIKNCQICNQPSGMYPLCKEHMLLKNEGKVVKNETTGMWELAKIKNVESINDLKMQKCIVCGEDAPHGLQCKACYYETKEFKDQLDKNAKLYEFNNYYYNLNGNLWRMSDFQKIKSNANKLFAIAILTKDLFNSDTLMNKVQNDIEKVIEKKKPKEKDIISEAEKKQDAQQEKLISTIDGHRVESQGERIIDDILFNAKIPHKYSPNVTEIDITEEQSIDADWFIPIVSATKGIYIEYWGMTTKDYLANKKRKQDQYKKHEIPLIQIEKEEPFEDINSLTTRIVREINRLAKEKYKTDPQY